jgi:hypothetical protein
LYSSPSIIKVIAWRWLHTTETCSTYNILTF